MHVPQWLALTIAASVILFGIFRIYLATGGMPDEERAKRRRGIYAMPRWQHGLIGALFILVGGALVATALGWNPVASPKPEKVSPGRGPGGAIMIDPLGDAARMQIKPKNSAQPAPTTPTAPTPSTTTPATPSAPATP